MSDLFESGPGLSPRNPLIVRDVRVVRGYFAGNTFRFKIALRYPDHPDQSDNQWVTRFNPGQNGSQPRTGRPNPGPGAHDSALHDGPHTPRLSVNAARAFSSAPN